MARTQFGVVRGASGRIYALIKPDDDRELDKACWTQMGDPADAPTLVRIQREAYEACATLEEYAALAGGHFAEPKT